MQRSLTYLFSLVMALGLVACLKRGEDIAPPGPTDFTVAALHFTTDKNQPVVLNIPDSLQMLVPYTYSLGQPANGALLADVDQYYRYVPKTDFVGEDSLTYTVCAGACKTAVIKVTVRDVVVPCTLQATNDLFPVAYRGLTTFNPVANDVTCGGPVTLTLQTTRPGLFQVNGSLVTYRPDSLVQGSFDVGYTICNSTTGICANGTITLVPEAREAWCQANFSPANDVVTIFRSVAQADSANFFSQIVSNDGTCPTEMVLDQVFSTPGMVPFTDFRFGPQTLVIIRRNMAQASTASLTYRAHLASNPAIVKQATITVRFP